MDEAERAALLSAMYDPPAEEAADGSRPRPPADPGLDAAGVRKSRRMVMGAVSFDVPTVEYVEALERRATQAERLAAEQARHIRRLDLLVSALRNTVRRTSSSLGDVARGLDGKLDRRDL